MIKVLFVCHGNICRSTMAESVFTHIIKEKNISSLFEVSSAGTSREEIGNKPHYGTVNLLEKLNIELVPHLARQISINDYEYYDYILVMDDNNIRNLNKMFVDKDNKIFKLMYFTGSNNDILDPWYTDNFEKTYIDITKGINAFLKNVIK